MQNLKKIILRLASQPTTFTSWATLGLVMEMVRAVLMTKTKL
jgi:hypothetical protein